VYTYNKCLFSDCFSLAGRRRCGVTLTEWQSGESGVFPVSRWCFEAASAGLIKCIHFKFAMRPSEGKQKIDMAVCLYKTAQDFNRHPILLGDLKKRVI